jgi:hypothetical protein
MTIPVLKLSLLFLTDTGNIPGPWHSFSAMFDTTEVGSRNKIKDTYSEK